MKIHHYKTALCWTGNQGEGTKNYRSYRRDFEISINGKAQQIHGSSDPSFLGDSSRFNPEELFLASLSSCHMLWYLHLCAVKNITVIKYVDFSEGNMIENQDGSGQFNQVVLKPEVTILEADKERLALDIHKEANQMCFIARSCNFPVIHKPKIIIGVL